MHHLNSSSYKGFSIATRPIKVATALDSALDRYRASYTVRPPHSDGSDSWQQFPDAEFAAAEDACANALRAAKFSVDFQGLRSPALSHSAWMQDAANQSTEKRLDLELVGLYGAEARRSGENAASNPYVGNSPRIRTASRSETWLHARAWRHGWNNIGSLQEDS